jgi:hypothetical protein
LFAALPAAAHVSDRRRVLHACIAPFHAHHAPKTREDVVLHDAMHTFSIAILSFTTTGDVHVARTGLRGSTAVYLS